jgi:hypothetical protein
LISMLATTVMGDHMHAQSIRPDRIIKTGVIEPYPASGEFNPVDIARRILEPFATLVPSTVGPQVSSDPSPEEIVEQARNYASAVDQGINLPPWLSQQALTAIRLIRERKPFVVTAQGRTLLVKPTLSTTTPTPTGQTPPVNGLGLHEIQSRQLIGGGLGLHEIQSRQLIGGASGLGLHEIQSRELIGGPDGTSLPGVAIDPTQQASLTRLGPQSTLLRTAGLPGRRQAEDRQQPYYVNVR